MIEFNRAYYENLWGTVHRHDYCETLANSLISKYGKGKILDIGTGCGELVRILRDKGCESYGLEISKYAVVHSCCPDFVRYGSITDIPFGSNRFDVVHSQGVFEYIPKEDIEKAWKECKRVGKIQHHTIDYKGSGTGEEDFVTAESEEWWKDQFYPRVLLACPTHECKEYAHPKWFGNVREFTYPNYEVLVVDNSPRPFEIEQSNGNGITWRYIANADQQHAMLRITQSMEVIRQYFLKGDYKYLFIKEIDVITPTNVIETLLELAPKGTDWISHSYPARGGNIQCEHGIGCSMLSRRLMENFDFNKAGDNSPDGWLWTQVKAEGLKYKTAEFYTYFEVEHLAQ